MVFCVHWLVLVAGGKGKSRDCSATGEETQEFCRDQESDLTLTEDQEGILTGERVLDAVTDREES